jgi:cell division protein FtsI/penicillin-binding protein 2
MLQGRWVLDGDHRRLGQSTAIVGPDLAQRLAGYMREVVTNGTARRLSRIDPPIAGKTGTAELENAPSHAWFAGFAPVGRQPTRRIAFCILIENGRYGGRVAAPVAGEVVAAARELGIIR